MSADAAGVVRDLLVCDRPVRDDWPDGLTRPAVADDRPRPDDDADRARGAAADDRVPAFPVDRPLDDRLAPPVEARPVALLFAPDALPPPDPRCPLARDADARVPLLALEAMRTD